MRNFTSDLSKQKPTIMVVDRRASGKDWFASPRARGGGAKRFAHHAAPGACCLAATSTLSAKQPFAVPQGRCRAPWAMVKQ
jgi:hypothetical protein